MLRNVNNFASTCPTAVLSAGRLNGRILLSYINPKSIRFQNNLNLLRCSSSGASIFNNYLKYRSDIKFRTQGNFIQGERRWMSRLHAHGIKKKSRRTFYDILEVDPLATQSEIKAAYYELSMKHHPDVSSSVEAREQFTGTNLCLQGHSSITNSHIHLLTSSFGKDQDRIPLTHFVVILPPFALLPGHHR